MQYIGNNRFYLQLGQNIPLKDIFNNDIRLGITENPNGQSHEVTLRQMANKISRCSGVESDLLKPPFI